jgi:hypothetical protein
MFRSLFWFLTAVLCIGLAVPVFAQVVLNEILYDTPGTDDINVMFTEIYGPPNTDLTGWTLVGTNGSSGAEYGALTLQGSIPADGYYVVGNTSSVPNVDYNCGGGASGGVNWQNAGFGTPGDCDGVSLKNAQGTVVDHVCYGTCASAGNCTGEGGTNAPDYDPPSSGPTKSIARVPDHVDTDNNAADWQILEPPTPGTPNTGAPCSPHNMTLSDVRVNNGTGVPVLTDTFVVVRGIANVDNFVLDSLSLSNFFIQDDDAGCNMFRGNPPANIVAGDCLVVSAWVYSYNGLTELVAGGPGNCVYDVERHGHVNPPTASLITGASPFENYEGMLVRLNHCTIVNGTWPAEGTNGNLTITDGNGTIGLNIVKWTNIDGTTQPTQPFDIIGIMSQYDRTAPYVDYYEIVPRSTADINPTAAGDKPAALSAKSFELQAAYPNPFNSVVKIRYEIGTARQLTLTIFDVTGREVAHEMLRNLTPGTHEYSWTPSGATGVYLVRLAGESATQTVKLLYLK